MYLGRAAAGVAGGVISLAKQAKSNMRAVAARAAAAWRLWWRLLV